MDFSSAPRYVYWEMTQACGLACRHCRATAKRTPHPSELTTAEARRLLLQIAAFGRPEPMLIFSGGDPLSRPDLFDLIDGARALEIPVAVTPSATPLLSPDTFKRFAAHDVAAVSMSLDGSTAERHEGIRNVRGCYDITRNGSRWAAEANLPFLVNTLVSESTVDDLPALYELLRGMHVTRWSLFFLVAVGRGKYLAPISAERAERTMEWIADISRDAPFLIGTTEAPAYRRVALERMNAWGWTPERIAGSSVHAGFGLRDGNGVVFISKTGDVYPTGFLPLSGGNVRKEHLVAIYRNSALFTDLHDSARLKGKCGACEFRAICGGSRARAFAATGDPLESDPLCAYVPPATQVA
jgi:radical SAM protein